MAEQLRENVEAVQRFIAAAPNDDNVERNQCAAVCNMIAGVRGLSFPDQAALMELINAGPWRLEASKAAITQALMVSVQSAVGPNSLQHGGPRVLQKVLHFYEYPTQDWLSEFTRKSTGRLMFFVETCAQCGITNPSEKSTQMLVSYFLYLDKGYAGATAMSMQERLELVESFKTTLRGVVSVLTTPRTFAEFPTTAQAGYIYIWRH